MRNPSRGDRPRLLYYDLLQYQASSLDRLNRDFEVVTLPAPGDDTDVVLGGVHVAMAPRGIPFGAAKMDRCAKLRVIGSSTLDVPHVDVAAARQRGIDVVCLNDQAALLKTVTATAELTWGLVLAVTRHLPLAYHRATAGQWGGRPLGRMTPRMLSAMTLGVVGMGRLGSMVAAYGAAFGMRVRYFSPSSRPAAYERCESLLDLASTCDVLTLHARSCQETRHMIDARMLASMKSGSFLINTARGELVDEPALVAALESGHLAGAGLDVLDGEERPDFIDTLGSRPLVAYARTHDNLVLTPHYAGATVDAWEKTEGRTIDLIMAAAERQRLFHESRRIDATCEANS